MGLRKTTNVDGTIVGFPGVEAIFDGFGVIVDCSTRLEAAQKQTIHISFPTVYRVRQKLMDISEGKKVWRGEGRAMAQTSVYSRDLCRVFSRKIGRKQMGSPASTSQMLPKLASSRNGVRFQ